MVPSYDDMSMEGLGVGRADIIWSYVSKGGVWDKPPVSDSSKSYMVYSVPGGLITIQLNSRLISIQYSYYTGSIWEYQGRR